MTPEALRSARKTLGLTQAQLAEALGLTRISITRYEAGRAIPLYIELAVERLLDRSGGSTGAVSD